MADKGERDICLLRRVALSLSRAAPGVQVAKESGMWRHLVGLNLVMACLLGLTGG
jgi:hypothetical protein